MSSGVRFRALAIVDMFARECLAIEVERILTGEDVVAALTRFATSRGFPQRIHCDNGSEYSGRVLGL